MLFVEAIVDVRFLMGMRESRGELRKKIIIEFSLVTRLILEYDDKSQNEILTKSIGFPMQFSSSDMNMMCFPAWFMSFGGSCGMTSPDES